MLQTFLVREGYDVGRLHVATLMKRMGIEAIYRRAQHVQTCAGAHDLPVSSAQAAGDAAQSGLGDGHHVYPHGAGLRLSCGRRRLVQPEGSGMEVIDYASAARQAVFQSCPAAEWPSHRTTYYRLTPTNKALSASKSRISNAKFGTLDHDQIIILPLEAGRGKVRGLRRAAIARRFGSS
jgi:hypothetical protein